MSRAVVEDEIFVGYICMYCYCIGEGVRLVELEKEESYCSSLK